MNSSSQELTPEDALRLNVLLAGDLPAVLAQLNASVAAPILTRTAGA
ncbi:MAG: hypothetical protein Q8L93_08455 [Rhodocyclaceae bacterium]|nr:hypothetical protein [Rhodocyclaceae bacterium]MDP1956796.1 hypothetical protein [Rhodocyclaceae bacterium]